MELSVDTSTRYASVGLSQDGVARVSYSWNSKQNHTVELLPAIEYVLEASGTDRGELSCIFVATGPGGFSALRVGLSVAKGLALSLQLPLLGLSTLEIEAYPYRGMGLPVRPLLDIGRGEVATALYGDDGGDWRRLDEMRIVSPQTLGSLVRRRTILCGEGTPPWASTIREALGKRALLPDQSLPTRASATLASIGYPRFLRGETDDAASLEPTYLRRPSITAPRPRR